MKIGILTSSRADFGIYLPLLKTIFSDNWYQPEIIAFGTHLSKDFGFTLKNIIEEGFVVKHKIKTAPKDDSPSAIALSISETIKAFSVFWSKNNFDLVLALGDRYEMIGAVLSGSPFNVSFAHIHAGETTLGAIDNAYRHSISLMSKYLFVSTEEYKRRAVEIIQRSDCVFNVGALSIDNLKNNQLLTQREFYQKFNIDLTIPTILTTYHPETIDFERNKIHIYELVGAIKDLTNRYQVVITMPNADTSGRFIRKQLKELAETNKKVIIIESFGMKGYLSCMKYCSFMLGNTSSGFVEAAFFPKWVINLGKRQEGRIITPNILSVAACKNDILNAVYKIESSTYNPTECSVYGDGHTAIKINNVIKQLFNNYNGSEFQ